MDQEKIGKLIAKLRKKQGLTQRELGDKVGVGYRAVSKWETGITSPDISIINDLSNILGISANELLKGELNTTNEKNGTNFNYKALIYIFPMTLVIILSAIIILTNSNKTYVYKLETTNPDYYIEGEVTFKDNDITLIINELIFHDANFYNNIIKNYQYEIYADNNFIVGYGYMSNTDSLSSPISINELSKIFKVNYIGKIPIAKNKIFKDGIVLKMTFIDEGDNEITKNIEIVLIEHD